MILRTVIFSLLILVAFFGATFYLDGQTTPAPRNFAPLIPGGVVGVIAPDGRTAYARLDPTIELTADASGFLVLRAAPRPVQDRVVIFKPTAAGTTVTLPSDPVGNSLQIAANGFVLSEPDDYSRSARVVTFVTRWAPVAGDLIQARYRE